VLQSTACLAGFRLRFRFLVFAMLAPLLAAPVPPAPVQSLEQRITAYSIPGPGAGILGIESFLWQPGKTPVLAERRQLLRPFEYELFTTGRARPDRSDYKFRTTVETTGTLDRYGRLNGISFLSPWRPNLSGRELPYDLKTQRNEIRFRR